MEPWLQHSLAQSREMLGGAWLDLYLNAPLWRFWWSSSLTGYGLAGAMMPSVDRVGRYFPLLAFAVAPQDSDFALPSLADDDWYARVENALLGALSHDAELEPLLAALDSAGHAPRAALAARKMGGSLWWSLAKGDGQPRRAAWPQLPPPTAFAGMLDETAATQSADAQP